MPRPAESFLITRIADKLQPDNVRTTAHSYEQQQFRRPLIFEPRSQLDKMCIFINFYGSVTRDSTFATFWSSANQQASHFLLIGDRLADRTSSSGITDLHLTRPATTARVNTKKIATVSVASLSLARGSASFTADESSNSSWCNRTLSLSLSRVGLLTSGPYSSREFEQRVRLFLPAHTLEKTDQLQELRYRDNLTLYFAGVANNRWKQMLLKSYQNNWRHVYMI